jgi:hypothetical protein
VSHRSLASCREEISNDLHLQQKCSVAGKKLRLTAIVCLIKVYRVCINTSDFLKTRQRIICGEDETMTFLHCYNCPFIRFQLWIGGRFVMSFSTVNVQAHAPLGDTICSRNSLESCSARRIRGEDNNN